MSQVFISIDTGGTRTNVEVQAPGTNFNTRRFEVAASLSGVIPVSQYASTLQKIFAPIENYWQQNDVPDIPVYVFMGAAGFAAPTRNAFLDTMLNTLPQFLNGNISAAGACNDTSALLWGHKADGAIIAGTGSNVLMQASNSELFQAGGHDWVATDYGAGFWIGLEATRQVARDLESGESSVLLNRFCEVYGISAGNEEEMIKRFRSLAVSDSNLKSDIARFAAAVCAAAELGDLDAQNIVKREAEDLADSVSRTVRRRFSKDEIASGLDLVQCGSLLANDFYKAAFESQVRMRLAGQDSANQIKWIHTKTGIDAIMNLSKRLPAGLSELLETPLTFRPVIIKF